MMFSSANEVMVRIVGNAYDAHQVLQDLLSISKHGAVELEDERGDFLFDEEMVRSLASEWAMVDGGRRRNTRDTTNIVLSLPACSEHQEFKNAARAFARRQFGQNHQYVMALHTDMDSPQVSLTVKNLGYDGHRLHVKKGDPQKWRESFAAELEHVGINARATLRAARRGEHGEPS